MKILRGFLLGLCGMLISAYALGQEAESIITESSVPMEEKYIDDIVKKRLIFENRVLPYEPIREADIPWEKRIWRVVDVREKLNLPFQYPEKPFFSIISDAATSGEIKVFQDEKFKEMLTPDEVLAKLIVMDTSLVIDPETYEEQVKVTSNPVNPSDIKRWRIKEIWYFDEETSTMGVRILGFAPYKDVYDDETGLFLYEIPLFWVYYPEVRDELARHRVFNDYNDASALTWYDLFEQRKFSSYIYKQSNVLDVRLKDIFPENGVDRLMESERIKREIFNWEHDLWSY